MKRSKNSTGAATRSPRGKTRPDRPAYPAARKRFGQHFLEPAWVARLVDAVIPEPGDVFLEIGPGRGALTHGLAPRVRQLVGIEIDRDLAALLAAAVPPHVRIVQGNFLDTDLEGLAATMDEAPLRVIGNLPYNLSSPILFKLVHAASGGLVIRDATMMLQLEVADRVAARPGSRDYGALAIQVARVADAARLLTLPPGAFRPPPRVSSAVVQLRFRAALDADPALFERIVRGVFVHRRKTMGKALEPVAATLRSSASELLERAGIDPRLRPEQLSPDDFARLTRAVL